MTLPLFNVVLGVVIVFGVGIAGFVVVGGVIVIGVGYVYAGCVVCVDGIVVVVDVVVMMWGLRVLLCWCGCLY